jgi:hypothetical protein
MPWVHGLASRKAALESDKPISDEPFITICRKSRVCQQADRNKNEDAHTSFAASVLVDRYISSGNSIMSWHCKRVLSKVLLEGSPGTCKL